MDPNETLTQLIAWAVATVNDDSESPRNREAAWRVINIHDWLSKGGFLPEEWERARAGHQDVYDPYCASCGANLDD